MLEELLQRFLAENGTWYYELKAAIMNCKQKGISMATYFSKFEETMGLAHKLLRAAFGLWLWENNNWISKDDTKRKKLLQFLFSLDTTVFGTIRSNTFLARTHCQTWIRHTLKSFKMSERKTWQSKPWKTGAAPPLSLLSETRNSQIKAICFAIFVIKMDMNKNHVSK